MIHITEWDLFRKLRQVESKTKTPEEVLSGIYACRSDQDKEDLLDQKIETLSLDARVSKCLKKVGIKTIRDILHFQKTKDTRSIERFGETCFHHLCYRLEFVGINLFS